MPVIRALLSVFRSVPLNKVLQSFQPRFFSFWVLAGFLVFWAVWKTSPTDVITDVKLIVTGALLVYVLAYGILERQFDVSRLRRDRGLALVVASALAYLGWMTLSDLVFSPSRSYTLIGWPTWHSGYLLYALCTGLFLVATLTRRIEGVEQGVRLAFFITVPTVLFCVLEYLGFNPLSSSVWFTSLTQVRVNEALSVFPILFAGNSGYVSAVWLLLLPFPLLVLRSSPRLSAAFWLLLAVGVSAAHGKASVLMFGAATLLLFVWAFRAGRGRWMAVALASFAVGSSGTFVYPALQQALVQAGVVTRERSFGFVAKESLAGRQVLWSGALRAAADRPLTGWGLETLQNHFFDYLPKAQLEDVGRTYLDLKPGETVRHFGYLLVVVRPAQPTVFLRQARVEIVKPHNMLIEEVYSHGLPGLVLLLLLAGSAGVYIWRSGPGPARVLALGFAAYAAYLTGWFLTPSVAPMAFMLFGASVSMAASARQARLALSAVPETLPATASPAQVLSL